MVEMTAAGNDGGCETRVGNASPIETRVANMRHVNHRTHQDCRLAIPDKEDGYRGPARRKGLALWLASLPLALALPAMAADTDGETLQLGTVVVTGVRRLSQPDSFTASSMRTTTGLALSPRETPQSVSVITQTQMKAQGIHDFEDALNHTTGVNVTRHGARAVYQTRGFYLEQLQEDGIGTTIGAPGITGNPFMDPKQQLDPAIYDHIEVVRGAAGLTQGPSEPGGTLNAVRKKPTSQTERSLDVLLDRWGTVRTVGDLSGTLSKERVIRGRLVAVAERNRSFKKDVDGNNGLLYGVADQTLGDGTRVTVGGLLQNQHDTPDPYGLPLSATGNDLHLPRDTFLGMRWNKGRYRKQNAFVEIDHYLDDNWNLNAKLDYRRTYSVQAYASLAGSGGPGGGISADGLLPLDGIERYDHAGNQLSFQLNLNGAFDALGRRHEAFVTYSYSRERLNIRDRSEDTVDRSFNIYSFTGYEVAEPDWSTYDGQSFVHNNFNTHGLAGGVRLNPADGWHILLATRYNAWHRDYAYLYNTRNGQADTRAPTLVDVRKNRFVPYAGLTYDLDRYSSVYLNYSSVFRYSVNVGANGQPLPPTLGRNYEVGWKSARHDGHLNLAVALFRVDQDNTAVNSRQRLNDGTRRFYWIPLTLRSQGLDAEVSGDITRDLKLFAGYTYNKRKYTASAGSFIRGEEFNKQTPRHMLRVYGNYRLPGAAHAWTIGAGMRTQSSTSSGWDVRAKGATVWDANAQYDVAPGLSINLLVRNLTDRQYYENNGIRSNGYANFYGEPRTVLLNASWKF
ncbi:MAG: TonB-dependent siderophore receptor [Lautropia sp.]|nr:TonB-dependent siderophore receptor [Lautropia sp.]